MQTEEIFSIILAGLGLILFIYLLWTGHNEINYREEKALEFCKKLGYDETDFGIYSGLEGGSFGCKKIVKTRNIDENFYFVNIEKIQCTVEKWGVTNNDFLIKECKVS